MWVVAQHPLPRYSVVADEVKIGATSKIRPEHTHTHTRTDPHDGPKRDSSYGLRPLHIPEYTQTWAATVGTAHFLRWLAYINELIMIHMYVNIEYIPIFAVVVAMKLRAVVLRIYIIAVSIDRSEWMNAKWIHGKFRWWARQRRRKRACLHYSAAFRV